MPSDTQRGVPLIVRDSLRVQQRVLDLGTAGALKALDSDVLERSLVVVYTSDLLGVIVHALGQDVEDGSGLVSHVP